MSFTSSTTPVEESLLSSGAQREFEVIRRLELIVPDIGRVEDQHLQISEGGQVRGTSLNPPNVSRPGDRTMDGFWVVDGGERALLQRSTVCKLQEITEPTPCILLFLVPQDDGLTVTVINFPKPVRTEVQKNRVWTIMRS